ncbi:hypothetical protein JL722_11731 [Aureococcus anophagefferens]|nr:hypothetical protein JL722_11731 [Aureococcus anophagefferens]
MSGIISASQSHDVMDVDGLGVVLRRDTLSASEAEALVAPFKALDGAGVEACFAGSVADDLFRLVGDLARHDAADVLGGGLSADEVAALSCYLRCCKALAGAAGGLALALELLAVLAVSGDAGYDAALGALEDLAAARGDGAPLEAVVELLGAGARGLAFRRDVMLFVNTLVNGAPSLERRVAVRADLVAAGVFDAVFDNDRAACARAGPAGAVGLDDAASVFEAATRAFAAAGAASELLALLRSLAACPLSRAAGRAAFGAVARAAAAAVVGAPAPRSTTLAPRSTRRRPERRDAAASAEVAAKDRAIEALSDRAAAAARSDAVAADLAAASRPPPPPPPAARRPAVARRRGARRRPRPAALFAPRRASGASGAAAPAAPAAPARPNPAPRVPMRALFWSKIDAAAASATVWRNLSDAGLDVDVDALERDFRKERAARASEAPSGDGAAAGKRVGLVDARTAQNVAIALAKLRVAPAPPAPSSRLDGRLRAVTVACEEVSRSEALARWLERVLRLGNYLNGGTRRGGALGFRLDALPKLAQVKSSADRADATLLHHLAAWGGPGDVARLAADLRASSPRAGLESWDGDLADLAARVAALGGQLAARAADPRRAAPSSSPWGPSATRAARADDLGAAATDGRRRARRPSATTRRRAGPRRSSATCARSSTASPPPPATTRARATSAAALAAAAARRRRAARDAVGDALDSLKAATAAEDVLAKLQGPGAAAAAARQRRR